MTALFNNNTDSTTTHGANNGYTYETTLSVLHPPKIQEQQRQQERCAINLWGLPRAFESLVLPSLIRNVILPNLPYNCDYFVHYYMLQEEEAGRSGQGGQIQPEQVLLLRDAVLNATAAASDDSNSSSSSSSRRQPPPTVQFTVTQETDFWKQYNDTILTKIHNTVDPQGKLLYFPWKARTYKFPVTVDNIIKMWHSIESVWELMEQYETTTAETPMQYTQIAMLRSDVVYMTPIDLYEYSSANKVAVVVPGFGRHPISDRIIYGPRPAVQIWATERFTRLDSHVQFMYEHYRGWGLHSERFVKYALFPAMKKVLLLLLKKKNYHQEGDETHNDDSAVIIEHPYLCFFRARADETVWVSDCESNDRNVALPSIREHLLEGGKKTVKTAVEQVLGRTCPGKGPEKLTMTVRTLNCRKPGS